MFHGKVIDASKGSISLDVAQKFITSEKCGASLFFIGTVRNHNNNKNVTGITYDSHDAIVEKSFKEIYDEAIQKLKLEYPVVFIEHTKGYVALGGISIIIAVAAKHRSQVYDLSRYIIEEIKKRTPIWKKEHYDDNESDWLKGNPVIDTEKNKMKKILSSEITPENIYQNRRSFMKSAAAGTASIMLGSFFSVSASSNTSSTEKLTSYKDIINYNNYYEFGTDKEDPSKNSTKFKTAPWSLTIEGEVEQTKTFSYEQIIKNFPSEERIYRLRCVEGWSMVIPWMGFSLSNLLKTVSPTSKAKFVEFISVYRPEEMIGQQSKILDWPYREGLRLDEAMHPLTIMATGLYGKNLPNQNGAPIRLVVPWKYGFKSAKAIVKIRLVENIPISSWMSASPTEYGFYSNVNPNVDHPRWSQATERRIGDSFLDPRRPTEMFNGYANEVSALYKGMDLRKYY